jgi:hypothetical protein
MFNDWANGRGPRMRKSLLIGVASLCWAMWTLGMICLTMLQQKHTCSYSIMDVLAPTLGVATKA